MEETAKFTNDYSKYYTCKTMIFTGLEVNYTYFRIWEHFVMTVEIGFKKVWGKKANQDGRKDSEILRGKDSLFHVLSLEPKSHPWHMYGRCKITFVEKSKGHG